MIDSFTCDACEEKDSVRAAGAIQLARRPALPGTVRVAFTFTVTDDGLISGINLIGDPDVLSGLEIELAG